MRISNGIALLLSFLCVVLVSADAPVDHNLPTQQITPNMTGGPSPGEQPDNQNSAPGQSGQAGGSGTVQPVLTPGQNSPGESGIQQGKGSGPEETKQPVSPSVSSQPQGTGPGPAQVSGTAHPDTGSGKTVSTPVQPSEKPAESRQMPSSPSGSGGSYREIPFPQSYPHFKQNNAAILVSSTPTGAAVYLDGSYKGTTPSSGYLELTDLSPGTYTVRLTSSGYSDYTTEVTLSRNEISTISADMTAEYVASPYGALSVQSSPSGAEVYLDNEYKGITPLTLQQITTGSHTVLIKKDGYSEYSGDVNIVSDQASGLSVTLTAESVVTPATPAQPPAPVPTKSPLSPWTVLSGLGITGLCLAAGKGRV